MPLLKPFHRIVRPFADGDYIHGVEDDEIYILSNDFAPDRATLIRAYSIIEKDLIELFNYIEPADVNLCTYSHKTYELLLRASTEFETNCKAILHANDYAKAGGSNLTIEDYYRIDKASKLSEYKVILGTWLPSQKVFQPFRDWSSGHTLRWYQSYNVVKHDRSTEFREASLENVMASVTGLLSILVSQFYVFAFNPYQSVGAYTEGDDGSLCVETSLFKVLLPTNWFPDEQYDFDWNVIKAITTPFDNFSF